MLFSLFGQGVMPTLHAAGSSPGFTFGVAGDFSGGTQAKAVAALWAKHQPSLSIGLGDLSYANSPPGVWCTSIWNGAVGAGDGFLVVGDHDTFQADRLTNYVSYGYWENTTGYANSCGVKGTGISWTGSGTVSNDHACNTSSNLAIFDTCFGREMYVDYPSSSPLVRFIVLCDGILSHPNATAWCNYGSSGTDAANHLTWLDNTVAQARQESIPWIIVLNHDHYFAAGPYGINYGSDLWNHLIADKVDIFITGEEHNYQRSYPLVCPTGSHDYYQNNNATLVRSCMGDTGRIFYSHGEGLIYLITGTGGQAHNPFNYTNNNWITNNGYFAALNDTTWGFNKFTVTPTTITDTFESATGSFTDTWSILYPETVGGAVRGIDKLVLVAPFLVSSALVIALSMVVVLYRRQTKPA